ncbi:hypothetical protein BJV82DRAFT_662255 [Fennellomyces sp. T-0311]|nr:hypothetical protein BJV82DRAFT_662255 [Fennellomyces sp. T-0311]
MPGNNHKQKSTDRRDSLKQQQRKNSAGKQKEYQQTSGSSKTTNTNTTSNNNSRATTPPIAAVPAPVTPHTVGLNGFNSAEIRQFLNQRKWFSDTMTAYHDSNAEVSTRPVKYESQEKAWGNKGGLPSVWGQKNGAMATGADLFLELVKPQQQQQPQQ